MHVRRRVWVSIAAVLSIVVAAPAAAQDRPQEAARGPLAELVETARRSSPRLARARHEANAADQRIGPAGAWDDPIVTLGVQNLPPGSFSFTDPGECCTQAIVQVAQRVPLPGKLSNRGRIASRLADAREYLTEQVRIDVVADVKRAYAELYYLDRALDVNARNLRLLAGLEDVTRTRYATGVGRQPAVLRAGLELDGLERRQVKLLEQRAAARARLDAAVGRPASAALDSTPYPSAMHAIIESGRTERGAFDLPGERADVVVPGLPSSDSLLAIAVTRSPEVRAHVARIRADEAAVDLARAEWWPDPVFALQYGTRVGASDRIGATVSFSVPVFGGRKQAPWVREAEQMLAADRSAHDAMIDDIERRVVGAYADLVDAYGQLGILDRGVIERAEANLDATLAAYRAGSEDFLALLDSQSATYRYELERHRSLADFLSAWAELERAVGEEIAP